MMLLLLCSGVSWSQEISNTKIPLIGDIAPSFTAETTNGQLDFPRDFGKKWKIIFSHPRDFTPVCSTEILKLAQMQDEFEQINIKLLVVSTDTLPMHKTWIKALEDIAAKDNHPVKIKFPLADDNNAAISKTYGMLHYPTSTTRDVRGVYIIDPENKIEAVFFYPMNIGRNMAEIKRTVIALQTAGKGKDHLVTPADWQLGDDLLVPHFPYTDKELKENPAVKNSYYNHGPFMWYKKSNQSLSGL